MSEHIAFPLPGSAAFADQRFGVFYAERLRRVPTGRVEASAIHAAWAGWAAKHGDGALGFKQLKAMMIRRGHRHFFSNRAWYGGVVLLQPGELSPAVTDTASIGHASQLFALDLVARIDAITADVERSVAELAELRLRLVAALQ